MVPNWGVGVWLECPVETLSKCPIQVWWLAATIGSTDGVSATDPLRSLVRPYNPSTLALTPGTRLGVYEVIAPIGEGGMGQVFVRRTRG